MLISISFFVVFLLFYDIKNKPVITLNSKRDSEGVDCTQFTPSQAVHCRSQRQIKEEGKAEDQQHTVVKSSLLWNRMEMKNRYEQGLEISERGTS